MSDNPERRPLQIHLSTLVCAVLLAGGMIYADICYYRKLCRAEEAGYRRYWQRYAENETLRVALFQGGCLILLVVAYEYRLHRREDRTR